MDPAGDAHAARKSDRRTAGARMGFEGRIGATVKFADEEQPFSKASASMPLFNIYAEAGRGFADHAQTLFTDEEKGQKTPSDEQRTVQ